MNCTSTMKMTKKADGEIEVTICYTHYGHTKDVEHIRLPKTKREEIAAKLQQGVKHEKIIDDTRNSIDPMSIKRCDLLDKQDIRNIESSFGLKEVIRHDNNQESVLSWIKEWELLDENPVIFYKMQGEESKDDVPLEKEDFIIIVQTPMQKMMLQKFGPKRVCIDSTRGTTAYDFLLTSILVVDDFGSGYPVAWCLANHDDTTTMTVFFNEIKKKCGVITPLWLMSDVANQFFNAWVGVMENRPIKLLCTWHVDRAWRENLRQKIGDLYAESETYKLVRYALEQTDIELFKNQLAKMLVIFQGNSKTEQFHQYFKHEWVPRQKEWAYCHRLGLGINTNMFVESFHRVFKHVYLKGKCNKRVDACLVNLLKFARDKFFERLIKITKGKQSTRLKTINDRHNRGLKLSSDLVHQHSDSQW